MVFNNVGNRKRLRIQILYPQVMQQGTRANLCKLAACRLFTSLPFRSHFVGEKLGGGGGGWWVEGGKR